MGGSQSSIEGYDIAELEYCTYFSRAEIVHIHKRFTEHAKKFKKGPGKMLNVNQILTLNELRYNPFGRRLCEVFSEDGSGDLGFEHFLDMLSVFSPDADDDVKFQYIFRIFDFNNDGYLDFEDVLQVLGLLTRNLSETEGLTSDQINEFAEHVMKEADLDGDRRLSPLEFEHLTSRIPDFLGRFKFRV